MRRFKIALMAVGAVALLGRLGPVAAFDAKEVGSFHIGGQALTLQGLPVKELVYTAGGPPTKMDPNGDFHTGQMYVQYVRLTNPKARYPLLLWHGWAPPIKVRTSDNLDENFAGGRIEVRA